MIAVATLLAAAALGASDATLLGEQLPQIHPHAPTAFAAHAAALRARLPELDDDQAVVAFMQLVASLGPRNGHIGIFPLDPGNRRAFHEHPLLPYEFADGVYVIGQIRLLVPHDNDATVRAFASYT